MSMNGITAGHRSLAQIGMMPAQSLPTVGTPVASVSSRTGTAFAADPTSSASTSAQYTAAVQGATAATAQPVRWDDSIRSQFAALGLTANQVAQVEALGLSESELQQAYTSIRSNPAVKQQIPDAPVGASVTPSGQPSGSSSSATVGGGSAIVSTGPAAWNEEWRKKFEAAGAPSDLIQQLILTGANGADAATLQQSLDQVEKTVNTEISKFREAHGDEYGKLVDAHTDKATLYQVAAAVNSGQVSKDQLEQVVSQAGMTPGKMIKDMVVKQILPWTFIPGWGAIRFGLSPFFGGKDPISGEKIHLDFWNHGLTGWMDAAMAAGGVMSLAMTARGGMQLLKGFKAIDAAHGAGLVGNVAKFEGLVGESGTMSLSKKLMAFLPTSSENRAVTGIARLGELEKGIAALPEGSVARLTGENFLNKLNTGNGGIGSKAGWGSVPFGLGNDTRGAIPGIGRRNKSMVELVTKDGVSMLHLDGRLTGGPELTAHVTSAAVDFLSPKQIAGLMSEYGVASTAELKTKVLAEAGTALGIGSQASSPLRNLLGVLRPGPVEDVLKAISNRPPSMLATAVRNPWVKFLGIGAASAGAMMLVKNMGGQPADQAGAQQGAASTGSAASGQLQLTADEQAAVQQFLALPVDQQQQVAQQAAQSLQQVQSQQLTPEQQAQVNHQAQVLQLMVELASQQLAQSQGQAQAQAS